MAFVAYRLVELFHHLLQALLSDKRAAGVQLITGMGVSPAAVLQDLNAGMRDADLLFAPAREPEKRKSLATLEKYAAELGVEATTNV